MASNLSRSVRVWGTMVVRPGFSARAAVNTPCGARAMGGGTGNPQDRWPIKVNIGKREIVGYGMANDEFYIDDVSAPFPAIRFKEDVGEIATLREKEKGDWKKMTLEEKKTLYRASFCQTFVEMETPTGEWKIYMSIVMTGMSIAMLGFLWVTKFVYPPLPDTITDREKVKAQIRRMIQLRVQPIEGLTSNYDYEKKEFRK